MLLKQAWRVRTVSAVSATQPVILFHPIPVVLLQQELVYFTFSRHASSRHTVAFELLLQRCNEIQLWVMTEVLLCPMLCKRVQLIKKFIKIAAQWVALLTSHSISISGLLIGITLWPRLQPLISLHLLGWEVRVCVGVLPPLVVHPQTASHSVLLKK